MNIKNYEEKKLQLGYFLSRVHNQARFEIHSIYRQWCQWWKEDFLMDNGKIPEVYNEKLVLTKRGARLEEKQPEIIDEYNCILSDVKEFLEEQHNKKRSRKFNSDYFKEEMFKLRDKHYEELVILLKAKKLDKKYYVANKTSHKHPCQLGKYAIYRKGSSNKEKTPYFGTYDDVKDIIENLSEKGQKVEER